MFKFINYRFKSLLMMAFINVANASCKEDPVKFDTIHPDKEPVQYDVPFEGVPNTADIVMYEINLRAFSNSGDIAGAMERLDEIKDLGVNVIWLMPIYTTGDLKSVGSPYAVKNYKEVNPDFGTLEDLRLFVKEAHKRDMAVILDWVANHTAWDNEWIKNTSWYTRDNEGNIESPQDWTDVADLNYDSQDMRNAMISAMKYWVLEANIDGYRCDYAEGVPNDFWQSAISQIRAIPERKLVMFAEARDKSLLTAGFDLTFGWNFYETLNKVYNENASAKQLSSTNSSDYTNIPQGDQILRWITNHDDNAWDTTPIEKFNGQRGSMSAFVISTFMGGVPLLYNGQEIGYPNQILFFEGTTSPIDWSLNPEIETEYKQLISIRNGSNAIKRGSISDFSSQDVAAFKRKEGSNEVLVLVNVRNSSVSYSLSSELANTAWQNTMTGENFNLTTTLTLEPYSYLILKN